MPPRANWKAYLRFSRVSIGINRKIGNRLKQQNVESETGEVVYRGDIACG